MSVSVRPNEGTGDKRRVGLPGDGGRRREIQESQRPIVGLSRDRAVVGDLIIVLVDRGLVKRRVPKQVDASPVVGGQIAAEHRRHERGAAAPQRTLLFDSGRTDDDLAEDVVKERIWVECRRGDLALGELSK